MDIFSLQTVLVPEEDTCDFHSFDFDDINLTDLDTCVLSMKMFVDPDYLRKFSIPYKVSHRR